MRLKTSAGLAALCAGLIFGGAASAQTYSRLVVFGDSLSDNGNLYAVTGGTQPLSPPYYQGRFSNGPVFAELLGFSLGRVGSPITGSIDYAFGGARTDVQANPPSLRNQVNMYLAAGGTFGANDLVTLWGGANNIFQGIPAASVNPNPTGAIAATATSAAADMGFLINQVTNAGARNVLVANLPNLAATPQFSSGPGLAAQPLAATATAAFNAALFAQAQAQAAAHPTSNIIFMDVYRAFEAVRANPTRFGFTNVTQSCLVGATVCATPATYAYWDGVHPTAAGHQLLAAIADGYLYYGNDGAATTVQGETALRHRGDSLDGALDRVGMHSFEGEGLSITATGGYDQTTYDARGPVGSAEMDTTSLSFRFEGQMSPTLRLGASFGGDNSDVTVGAYTFDAESVGGDVYFGWRSGSLFVNGAAGFSHDNYDEIDRATALGPVHTASTTQGLSTGAKLQAGLWFDMGGLRVSPRAAFGYARTTVDGYSETGDAVALLQFDEREVSATTGEASVRVEGDLGDATNVFVEAGYRDSLSYEDDGVTVRIAGNTALPITAIAEDPEGSQTILSAGVETRLWDAWRLGVGYRGRFGDHSDSQAARVSLSLNF